VVKRLVHLARYRAVQELDNTDPASPLKGKLVARLFAPAGGRGGAAKPLPAGEPATIGERQALELRIENHSQAVLNVVVLDLQPDWGITCIHPPETEEEFDSLDPDGEPIVVSLTGGLPEGYKSGTDTLKVLATLEPARFRTLELPALDQPAAPKGATRTDSPLDQLFRAVAADRPPTRQLLTTATPSRGWAVAQLEIRVVREGK
jgi:hypothetical protein